MRLWQTLFLVKPFLLWPGVAAAHVSQQGFVLLLPTGAYMAAGVAAVVVTVAALFVVPPGRITALFSSRPVALPDLSALPVLTSLASTVFLGFAIHVGLTGPRDPLSNLMPLLFWTIGWMALVSLSGILGDVWRWLNPWTGLYRLLGAPAAPFSLPPRLGRWPAVALMVGFALFLLVDIAPDDPARLATLVAIYWFATMAGVFAFGLRWLHHAELGHALIGAFASLAVLRTKPQPAVGGPGWQICEGPPMQAAGAFALTLLAVGSFDGLNETFWWFAMIGVNPLEFPGRSAVVTENALGLLASIAALFALFALTVQAGLLVAGQGRFRDAFGWMATTLLPIALAYHVAHYLTAFLVTSQYTLAALSDPWAAGADFLGIDPFYVTTGFFNRIDSVRLIWLVQAGAVVVGHVWSVLLSHRVALAIQHDHRRAVRMTLPLSLFMIAYTFLGLWLLAAPRGV